MYKIKKWMNDWMTDKLNKWVNEYIDRIKLINWYMKKYKYIDR